LNKVDDFLSESLAGFATAHSDLVMLNIDPVFLRRRNLTPGKVALISGGGSGHEPLHAGFVGYGMLDAACPGQVFTSPTPDQMIAAAQAADTGAGDLFVVKNYSGDVMNFDMAAELCETHKEMVLVNEDLAPEKGAELLVLVNGLGGTPLGELYLLFNSARQWLEGKGFRIARSLIGNVTTSLEMAGASLTLCVLDDEIKTHWDSPVHTPALRWGV